MSTYESLRAEILEKKYKIRGKEISLVDIFVKNNSEFQIMCKAGEISSGTLSMFDKIGSQFIEIYDKTDIEFFRPMKCEEVLKKYCSSNKEKKVPIKKVNTVPIEKNLEDIVLEEMEKKSWRWVCRKMPNGSLRYTVDGVDRLIFDVIDKGEKYFLQYKKKSYDKSCERLEAAILKSHPIKRKYKVITVYHTKEELQRNAEKKKRKKDMARERRRKNIEAYQEKQKAEMQKEMNADTKENELKLKQNNKQARNQELNQEHKIEDVVQIGYKDFVVRRTTFKCMHDGHNTEDITASISIITNDSEIRQIKVSAGFCRECQIYFIMDSTYERLRTMGVPICRISDEKYYKKSGYLNGMKLAQESILMQYGYSVSQAEGVSESVRRKILAVLIDNCIMSKSDIISYLDFFISQRQYQSKFELAIAKWENDRDFVENYRIGEYKTYGVNAIYR